MKIKAKSKSGQLKVKVKLSSQDIDFEELDLICRVFVRGFLKPSVYKKSIIEYRGTGGVALKKHLKKLLSKYEFLFLMQQISMAAQTVKRSGLHQSRLWLDCDKIFINEATKELQFIYLPVIQLQHNPDILTFMKSVSNAVKPMCDNGDLDFVSRFMYFLYSMDSFDPLKIQKYIEQEDSRVTKLTARSETARSLKSLDGITPVPKSKSASGEYQQADMVCSNPTELLEHTVPADDREVTSTLLINEDETALLETNEDSTQLLNEEESTELIHYPTLIRKSTGETILIDKPVFRLGKDKSCVDYVISDNNTVSKSHADIVVRKEHYYVLDLNSKNKTFLNKRLLPAQYEVEIFDGDTLMLSNEEFTFSV